MWFILASVLNVAATTGDRLARPSGCERYVDVLSVRSDAHEVAEILRWIALVHPAQSKVRETTRSSRELTNMRAISSAFTLYPAARLHDGRSSSAKIAARLIENMREMRRVLDGFDPRAPHGDGSHGIDTPTP